MTTARIGGCTNPSTPLAHHWMIEPPNGPQSWGECKWCHKTRKFNNGWQIDRATWMKRPVNDPDLDAPELRVE